jgi:hypothetical protein
MDQSVADPSIIQTDTRTHLHVSASCIMHPSPPLHTPPHALTLKKHHRDIPLVRVQRAVVVPQNDAPTQRARALGVIHLVVVVVGVMVVMVVSLGIRVYVNVRTKVDGVDVLFGLRACVC